MIDIALAIIVLGTVSLALVVNLATVIVWLNKRRTINETQRQTRREAGIPGRVKGTVA